MARSTSKCGFRPGAITLLIMVAVAGCASAPQTHQDPGDVRDIGKPIFSDADTGIPPRAADYGAHIGPSGYVARRDVGRVVSSGGSSVHGFGGGGALRGSGSSHSVSGSTGGRTCHVGPQGGTFTITANGNKNYGGC